MKEVRELETATKARDAARTALTVTSRKLRGRLAPRLLAAELAEILARRAALVVIASGITKRRRFAAAVGSAAAVASAIVLRTSQKTKAKKNGDLPAE